MLSWLLDVLKALASPIWRFVQRLRSRHYVKERLGDLGREEQMTLHQAYLGASSSEDRVFGMTITGTSSGLDLLEAHLHFLIIEGAATKLRREEQENSFTQYHRLEQWLYDHIDENPGLRVGPD